MPAVDQARLAQHLGEHDRRDRGTDQREAARTAVSPASAKLDAETVHDRGRRRRGRPAVVSDGLAYAR